MRVLKTIIIVLLCSNITIAQNFINNGAKIIVNNGAYVYVGGSFVNLASTEDAEIDMTNSTIEVKREWVNNNNTGEVFKGQGNQSYVILSSYTQNQTIGGYTPTYFDNLTLKGSKKILDVDNCKVEGILNLENTYLDLNHKKIHLLNPYPEAITELNGFVRSETNADFGYGMIIWNIKDIQDEYIVPFGTGATNYADIPLTFKIVSSGDNTGKVSFATYPTTNTLNYPYPQGVMTLSGFEPELMIDRFWIIKPEYETKPAINIGFTFAESDYKGVDSKIEAEDFKAIRYNNVAGTWNDMDPIGEADATNKIVYTGLINETDFYGEWTLINEEHISAFYIPKSFTPNGDGLNDLFGPISKTLDPNFYSFYIYDRWGKLIFTTNDLNIFWDGKLKNSNETFPQGVYTYLIYSRDILTKSRIQQHGIVTIVK